MRCFRLVAFLLASVLSVALAQTSTNISLNLTQGSEGILNWEHALTLAQTGSVGTLGYAALVFTSSSGGFSNGNFSGPTQITVELAFNEVDTVAINFTYPEGADFGSVATINLSGGAITGGTGAYAGASGSLNLTIVKSVANVFWTNATGSGSGNMIVGGKTIPLTLTNFNGACCAASNRERNYNSFPVSVSGSLGNGSGEVKAYYFPSGSTTEVSGVATINFTSTDSLTLFYFYAPAGQSIAAPSSFSGNILGGTGKYANAHGALNWSTTSHGFQVTGTMNIPAGAAVITLVKTAYGGPQIAYNTWLEIHGSNLVPADTPATGVDWSNAPDLANGMMPTELGGLSVVFGNGNVGYIYFYCSAQTDPNCADDQINVLAPLLPIADSVPMGMMVYNNLVPIAVSGPLRDDYSPAFFSFDALGHVAARHLDASLVGPSSLYPGSSTPAKVGEIISLYGTGFGPPSGGPLTAGSATQSGLLPVGVSCYVSGLAATTVGALVSPGLYQFNLTVPKGTPSGDNPVICVYAYYTTFAGSLIAVQ